jgi:hypothetical protein
VYKLSAAGFFGKSEGVGLGYPLFSKDRSNSLYICETDNYNLILNFFMVPELHDYNITNIDEGAEFSVGDAMPILIRDAGGDVLLMSYAECLSRLDELTKGQSSIFVYNIFSILGLEVEKQIENLESISKQYLQRGSNASAWLAIEKKSIESDIDFWRVAEQEKIDKTQYVMAVTGLSDINDVLRWLMRPASIRSHDWYNVWRISKELMPQEKLIYGAAARWISDKYIFLSSSQVIEDQDFMEVLFYIVEDGDDMEQVSDILEELLTEEPDVVPFFLRTKGSYRNLRKMMGNLQAWEVLQAIDKFARLRGYRSF